MIATALSQNFSLFSYLFYSAFTCSVPSSLGYTAQCFLFYFRLTRFSQLSQCHNASTCSWVHRARVFKATSFWPSPTMKYELYKMTPFRTDVHQGASLTRCNALWSYFLRFSLDSPSWYYDSLIGRDPHLKWLTFLKHGRQAVWKVKNNYLNKNTYLLKGL